MNECLNEVRAHAPLVHCITNYVTVNDVANVILACGGSPIMSDEPQDVEDITSICNALCINIGTLHKASIESMFIAGRKAAGAQCPHRHPAGPGRCRRQRAAYAAPPFR